ncbi:MAG: phosphoribosyltransferase family protein [Candidatus Diapherotrites archaeon]|nr:phosphoribosyltransferase family protein [Candidatus Diapherotrites archaeon]
MAQNKLHKRILANLEKSIYLVPSDSESYQYIVKRLIQPFKKPRIDKVISTDMNGLLYGPIVANKLRKPFVPILKGGKINNRNLVIEGKKFTDHSGRKKYFEIMKGAIKNGERILYIDDWVETGNSARTVIDLVEKCGGRIIGISIMINQLGAKDERHFQKHNFHYIIKKPK